MGIITVDVVNVIDGYRELIHLMFTKFTDGDYVERYENAGKYKNL